MTYDPFQAHSLMGAYPGLTNPLQSAYASLNPLASFNPLAAIGAGVPQQLQLAQILAARAALSPFAGASPWSGGLNNPLLAAAGIENPLLNPMLAQSQFGAPGYPVQNGALFGQIGSGYGQIGPMLAPQSWIGQPGPYGAHAVGQIHPLMSQLAGRGYGAGIF